MNIIKKFLNYIKNIFYKNDVNIHISESNDKEKVNSELLTDDIFDDFKVSDNKNNISYNEFKNLYMDEVNKNAEILIVSMDKEYIRTNNIGEKHQTRPFIKIREDKENGKIYGYYATSNINNIKFRNDVFRAYKLVLSSNKYKLNKNTLISHDKLVELPVENIKHNIDILNDDDLTKLIKLSALYRGQNLYSSGDLNFFDIGDMIINEQKLYLIYQKDKSIIYGVHIIKADNNKKVNEDTDCNYIYIGNSLYKILHNDLKSFLVDGNLLLCGMTDVNTIIRLIDKKKDFKHQQKLIKKSKRK